MSKKKILLRAPVLTQSGYGVHSRQIFRWLQSRDDFDLTVQALSWGNTPWFVDRKAKHGLIGEIMDRTKNITEPFDLTIQVQLPNEWDTKLGRFNIGVTAAVETDRCNPEWVTACNRMDLVIVPSHHTKKVLESSGAMQKKIIVIPESFIDSVDADVKPLDLPLETSFNFLIFGQLTGEYDATDRKNTYRTLKWLCETFRKDDDVGIIIKTNCGNNTNLDRRRCIDILRRNLSQFRKKGENPPVYLLHGDMTDNEVAGLYKNPTVKALVALTRGEGYGLPILEAAASDVPVIATDWSGHLDFMNKGKFVNIGYDLQEISEKRVDNKIFVKGAKWAEVRETAAKKAFKKFRASPEIPKEWAVDLGKTIREDYSQEAISRLYTGMMAEFEVWWS